MFAVLTHSRLRGPHVFPRMLAATFDVRRDLREARGLLRAANLIAGPTEFLTLTVWTDRDAMYGFMSSGAHERIMWRWPEWLSAFWLTRLAPTERESGRWRRMSIAGAATRGTAAHAQFRSPGFASHEPRPRDLERHQLGATTVVVRPRTTLGWPAAFRVKRSIDRIVRDAPGRLRSASGLSLDGELVSIALWHDEASATAAYERISRISAKGLETWTMCWRPLDEFGTWDGMRLRHLFAAS